MKTKSQLSLLLSLLIFSLLFATFVSAEQELSDKEQQTVNIGLYVLNIGKFDVTAGTYTIDFYFKRSLLFYIFIIKRNKK